MLLPLILEQPLNAVLETHFIDSQKGRYAWKKLGKTSEDIKRKFNCEKGPTFGAQRQPQWLVCFFVFFGQHFILKLGNFS